MPVNLLEDDVQSQSGADEKEYHWTLNFGPQHPATHTTLRLVLDLDGERIVKATPHIGYLHSGFEKLGEHLTFNQYVTIVDRKNYISPPMNEVAWHNAVEKLLDIELTPRCKYIRVIIGELARISDHLLCTGAAALDLGAFTAFLYAFNTRELIYDVYEQMSGYRFHPGYTRVGGVLYDFDEKVFQRIDRVVQHMPKVLKDMEKLLFRNKIFLDRMRGVGVLTKEMATDFSCTGPIARASGVTYDLRKDQPYLAYPDLEFQVPYATEGDCYARFQVRMEEMVQSVEIIRQAVKNIPGGPANVAIAEKYPLPDKATAYNSMEGLIQHFELIMPNRGPDSPVDEVYAAIESPNGELGYYLVSDGSQVSWRTRTRPPSFIHFSVFPHIIKDHLIADIVAVLGSLNIIAAELDR
ncbi:NADH dehydrogenase (quinone) subunit D [Tautonia plasticadhaerens]|uniref:NADH-quinone oxidoreductase subunit D n=1 Tax=Tautonia plasticadhaerens TaxID=2527974 RepID=A0A518H8I6_9BACT|nr:NADH dehydrogenase (quinone) subunit D [Tautonia plasticadhaerens]QDV37155.1 NADH-quinone oxidoreductase subunit 4 [Tautonia plasticadhaerens]